jgi:hypothetical protein
MMIFQEQSVFLFGTESSRARARGREREKKEIDRLRVAKKGFTAWVINLTVGQVFMRAIEKRII